MQVAAFAAACNDAVCAGAPIYSGDETPPGLRAAIVASFTDEVQYLTPAELEELTGLNGLFEGGGTYITVGEPRLLNSETAGIDVWVLRGPFEGVGRTYLFRWNGADWIRASPEELGIVVTTAVP
ncbi:MAG TPA: hypothetical protein VJR05_14275 [Acidimicrobiia bacterium]|nr:hypothetical protein [Acidimicrobiia bacterium]